VEAHNKIDPTSGSDEMATSGTMLAARAVERNPSEPSSWGKVNRMKSVRAAPARGTSTVTARTTEGAQFRG
jgi:hypothetical protein